MASISVVSLFSIKMGQRAGERLAEQRCQEVSVFYDEAIKKFHESVPPNNIAAYPREVGDLLRDFRFVQTRRYLRTVYDSPWGSRGGFVFIKNLGGEIIAVKHRLIGRDDFSCE
jgi:hypothetical protein